MAVRCRVPVLYVALAMGATGASAGPTPDIPLLEPGLWTFEIETRREGVFIMSPRVSMSAPWFEMTLDRGIVSSDRIVTTLIDPDRHQHEHWRWQRSIRSGMLEDDIQSLHELSVWERQGPCPPGMPIGPIFDEETQRMIREMVQRRNAAEAASAPPSKAPKPRSQKG